MTSHQLTEGANRHKEELHSRLGGDCYLQLSAPHSQGNSPSSRNSNLLATHLAPNPSSPVRASNRPLCRSGNGSGRRPGNLMEIRDRLTRVAPLAVDPFGFLSCKPDGMLASNLSFNLDLIMLRRRDASKHLAAAERQPGEYEGADRTPAYPDPCGRRCPSAPPSGSKTIQR